MREVTPDFDAQANVEYARGVLALQDKGAFAAGSPVMLDRAYLALSEDARRMLAEIVVDGVLPGPRDGREETAAELYRWLGNIEPQPSFVRFELADYSLSAHPAGLQLSPAGRQTVARFVQRTGAMLERGDGRLILVGYASPTGDGTSATIGAANQAEALKRAEAVSLDVAHRRVQAVYDLLLQSELGAALTTYTHVLVGPRDTPFYAHSQTQVTWQGAPRRPSAGRYSAPEYQDRQGVLLLYVPTQLQCILEKRCEPDPRLPRADAYDPDDVDMHDQDLAPSRQKPIFPENPSLESVFAEQARRVCWALAEDGTVDMGTLPPANLAPAAVALYSGTQVLLPGDVAWGHAPFQKSDLIPVTFRLQHEDEVPFVAVALMDSLRTGLAAYQVDSVRDAIGRPRPQRELLITADIERVATTSSLLSVSSLDQPSRLLLGLIDSSLGGTPRYAVSQLGNISWHDDLPAAITIVRTVRGVRVTAVHPEKRGWVDDVQGALQGLVGLTTADLAPLRVVEQVPGEPPRVVVADADRRSREEDTVNEEQWTAEGEWMGNGAVSSLGDAWDQTNPTTVVNRCRRDLDALARKTR